MLDFFNGIYFIPQKNPLHGVSRGVNVSRRRVTIPVVVAAAVNSNGKPGDGNVSVLVEDTIKEIRDASPVVEKDSKSNVSGGVADVYGEDTASEDQSITPWTVSVAR